MIYARRLWRRTIVTATPPRALLAEIRQRAQALDPEFNLFIHLLSEAEQAPFLAALEGHSPDTLPLYGVPFAIKDNIDLAEIVTTAACPAFAYRPTQSATIVAQLIARGGAGGQNQSRSVCHRPERDPFAVWSLPQRVPSRLSLRRLQRRLGAGGSPGVASFALGTDTAGSGRVPAGLNNPVGLKATKG